MTNLKPYTIISPTIVLINGLNPGPFTLEGTNTYLIGTGKERLLVDTGEGKIVYKAALKATLEALKVTSIAEILISHRHYDHIGGVEDIHILTGQRDLLPRKFMCVGEQGEYSSLVDGQRFEVEGAVLETIYTPGHTNDHCAFFLASENTLFTGDCILGAGTAVFDHLGTLMASLDRMRVLNPRRLLCGHGPVAEDGPAKIQEYINHRLLRESQILKVLEKEQREMSSREIVEIIYPGYAESLLKSADASVTLHLWKLVEEQRVVHQAKKFKLS